VLAGRGRQHLVLACGDHQARLQDLLGPFRAVPLPVLLHVPSRWGAGEKEKVLGTFDEV
jgi:hypothetical protein